MSKCYCCGMDSGHSVNCPLRAAQERIRDLETQLQGMAEMHHASQLRLEECEKVVDTIDIGAGQLIHIIGEDQVGARKGTLKAIHKGVELADEYRAKFPKESQ